MVGQREHQSAVAGQPGGTELAAGPEPGVRAGDRIQGVHLAAQDVHPAQPAAGGVPERPFGQFALGRDRDLRVQGSRHGAPPVVAGPTSTTRPPRRAGQVMPMRWSSGGRSGEEGLAVAGPSPTTL